jgi:hypothetical protein
MTRDRKAEWTNLKIAVPRYGAAIRNAIVFCLLFCMAAAVPTPTAAIGVQEAKEMWADRQKTINTASFTFVKTHFIPAGSPYMPGRGRIATGGRGGKLSTDESEPESDVTYEATFVVKLDREKVRVERVAPPILIGGELSLHESSTELATFDGTDNMNLLTSSMKDKHPIGSIVNPPESPIAPYNVYRPILWHYRASKTELGRGDNADKVVDTGDTGTIEGRNCQIFQQQGRRVQQYWVDIRRKACLMRYVWLNNDRTPHMTIDISYTDDATHGPVPTKWTVRQYEQGAVLAQQEEVKVSSYELNTAIDADEFRITFPVGAVVTDQRTSELFIVREGGKKRPISPREQSSGISYQQLLNSEPDEAFGGGRSTLAIVMLVLTVFVIIVLIWLSVRQRRMSL